MEYPEILISVETEIGGHKLKKGVTITLKNATEETINESLLGPIGEPLKNLFIAVVRSNKYKDNLK